MPQDKMTILNGGTIFLKENESVESAKSEEVRTQEAFEIFQREPIFQVPRIYGREAQKLKIEYFKKASNFSTLLKTDFTLACKKIETILEIVDAIESKLKHSEKLVLSIEHWKTKDTGTFVHGDFTIENLMFENNKSILIDWQSSRFIDQQFNYAPKGWDIMFFIQGLLLSDNLYSLKLKQRHWYANELFNKYLQKNPSVTESSLAGMGLSLIHKFYQKQFIDVKPWYHILKHWYKWQCAEKFWKVKSDGRT